MTALSAPKITGDEVLSLQRLVGRCIVVDNKGWQREGTVMWCAPCRREKDTAWFFFDEPRFPWRVRDLLKAGFSVTVNARLDRQEEA